MSDYNLGRAHGQIAIDYDGSGADKADADLQKVAASAAEADASLSKTQKTLKENDRQLATSGSAADGYRQRLRELGNANAEVEQAEKQRARTLLDVTASTEDIARATENHERALQRQSEASKVANDAHKALFDSLGVGGRISQSFSDLLPNLGKRLQELGTIQEGAAQKSNTLARALTGAAKAAAMLGPDGEAAAVGLEVVAKGVDKAGQAASTGGRHIRDFVKDIAGFEASFGKVAGMSLAVPSLGGLAGIGGGAGVQGIVEMADAVRQLSGVLGLLPAAASGIGVVMGTMKIAFHGVGDALKSMMADDPKKFLQDIANMGPAAAHSMLQIAQFRDQFKMAGGAIQDSFFTKVAADIQPLIQTWLPALTRAGSQISGVMGQAADQFAKLLMQPQTMAAFTAFINNISKGLYSLEPAMKPLMNIFTQLSVVGSSFFSQIGGKITHALQFVSDIVNKAAASGQLQQWIQTGINAFDHLARAVFSFGSAFNDIMNIADKFGGGGLLGWLDKLGSELQGWTESAAGQKALTDFFSTLRDATDAFVPMLGPLLNGLVSIGGAFVHLGVDTAPAWLDFFKSFANTMANDLGPAIQGMGPAVANFLDGLSGALQDLMQNIGPQLPQIFEDMANAFVQLLPQLPILAQDFAKLIEAVGPQLGPLFATVTDALQQLTPLIPTIIELFREFVSAVTIGVKIIGGLVEGINGLNNAVGKQLPEAIRGISDAIGGFFSGLYDKAKGWGKNLLDGLVEGLKDPLGLGSLGDAAKSVVDGIADWFQHSPAKKGPFSGSGYTLIRGAQMVKDMATGMVSAQSSVTAAAASTAAAAAGALSVGTAGVGARSGGALAGSGGAPSPGGAEGVGGALLPDNIAGADTSVLDAYLNHQFDDNRGLKGLAKDLGNLLSAFQNGFNLISQHVISPLTQVMGMIPGLNQQRWTKMSPQEIADQQQQEMQRRAIENAKNPTWTQVLGGQPGDQATHMTTPGGTALADALKAKGFSQQQIRLILAFSEVEGNNPAGNPTLGFTDAQLGGATDLQSHVDALAKQFINRASVAGAFPEGGTDLQQAQWIAKVVGQAGLSSGGQGKAQPQDYVQRIVRAMGLLPGAANPSWQQITGGGLTGGPAAPILPPGTAAAAAGVIGQSGIAENPASRATQVPNAPNVEAGIRAIGGLPTLYPTSGPGAYQVPAWAQQLAAAFGLTASTYASGGSLHQMGYAFDFNGPQANMDQFATFISQHLAQQTLQLIHASGNQRWGIASGQDVSAGGYYAGDYGGHFDHVHWATDVPVLINGQIPAGSMLGLNPSVAGSTLGLSGQTGYPDVNNALKVLNDTTGKQLSVNDQLLQSYLQGNPALADQINAAKTPGASDQQVQQTLNSISTTITGLKAQDAVGNKNTIDALQSAQSQIAQQQGFTQAPSAASMASQVASGVSGIASSAMQTIQSVLQAMSATQDIADRLVYGIRNTEDINKIIDDVQNYITLASSIANTTGQVLSTIGGIVGAGGSSDTSGSSQAASMALSAAGQIAQLVGQALQGVNMAIDFGQQIYHIAGTYVGRFLSTVEGMAGTPLMGNVRMELNKNTGQLIAYSEDNPQNQDVMNVPAWLNQTYDYGGGQNPNPRSGDQFIIYGGPGQSAGQLLNASMWAVQTRGTSGALASNRF